MNEVTAVRRDGGLLRVETDGGAHTTRALIVASGSRFTTLGVPGEEEFIGRGLSHCASCDGAFFMEEPVIVVGGGDAAVDEAIHLTQYAASVTVVHRRDTVRACASLQERAREEWKLPFKWNTALRAIEGADGVERVQLEDLTTGRTAACARESPASSPRATCAPNPPPARDLGG